MRGWGMGLQSPMDNAGNRSVPPATGRGFPCHEAARIMRPSSTLHEVVVNFHETIQLQALKLKQSTKGNGEFGDAVIDMAIKQDPTLGGLTRNICAHVSVDLFERVEQCCSMLDLSKRRFVEMALREAIERAETIVAEIDPFPGEA